ncbi:MAG: hypothetical protein QOH55_571 [Microbacteriaceae bacterium]|nr:hypothetical protein [Microbacteriaceae bacterium]
MAVLADTFTASLGAVRSAADAIPAGVETVKQLDQNALLASLRALSEIRRVLDARVSLVAGEIGYRSRRDLGYDGLAQKEGFRTPEALIQHETGSTARGALTLVQAGAMVHDALAEQQPGDALASEQSLREPWLTVVGTAVANGTLSVDAANAIRSGLGEPATDSTGTTDATGAGVTSDDLAAAATTLVAEAVTLNADRLFKRARELRDQLDAAGIANREREIYNERSVRRVRRPNGLSRYILDPDIESAAFWDDVYDTLTSPRRGGPRFVDDTDKSWADAISGDPRTTEQYVHDALTQLLRIGVDTDTDGTHTIVGSRPPAVRVLVTATALAQRTGHGRIEGSDIPVSIETVERAACTAGTVTITFDDTGQPINLGRDHRLYNTHQRVALAARDGGCRWPGCDRTPRWCEAHHTRHWKRDHGHTNLTDGLLLCRHHHLLAHNNHWEIQHKNSTYWLIPPPDIDPTQTPRPMPSKSAALRDLQLERPGSPGVAASYDTSSDATAFGRRVATLGR